MRRIAVIALLLLAASAAPRPARAAVASSPAVEIAPGISLALPPGWSEAPRFYRNAHEFVRLLQRGKIGRQRRRCLIAGRRLHDHVLVVLRRLRLGLLVVLRSLVLSFFVIR